MAKPAARYARCGPRPARVRRATSARPTNTTPNGSRRPVAEHCAPASARCCRKSSCRSPRDDVMSHVFLPKPRRRVAHKTLACWKHRAGHHCSRVPTLGCGLGLAGGMLVFTSGRARLWYASPPNHTSARAVPAEIIRNSEPPSGRTVPAILYGAPRFPSQERPLICCFLWDRSRTRSSAHSSPSLPTGPSPPLPVSAVFCLKLV